MKKTLLFLAGLALAFGALPAEAQELVLLRGNERLPLTRVDTTSWSVELDGELYLLLPKEVVQTLTKKIRLLQNDVERYTRILAAKDSLLAAFGDFQSKAEKHIETQEELISTADSLYTGYKSLYKDLKRLAGLSTIWLSAGVGLVDPPGGSWRPVGSLGLGFNNWTASFEFGKSYRGISMRGRLPLF